MNEDFVPYELAVKLKEKGFREKTLGGYMLPIKLLHFPLTYSLKDWNKADDCYSAPTIFQVLKWLRKEKDVVVSVNPYYGKFVNVHWWWDIRTPVYKVEICSNIKQEGFASYEEAAIAGIEYVIDNLI